MSFFGWRNLSTSRLRRVLYGLPTELLKYSESLRYRECEPALVQRATRLQVRAPANRRVAGVQLRRWLLLASLLW
jgi:hypothetical protein